MEINKAIKTPQGTVEFRGELSQEEFDFVLQVGLSTLFAQGAIPFTYANNEEAAIDAVTKLTPGTDTTQ